MLEFGDLVDTGLEGICLTWPAHLLAAYPHFSPYFV